MPDNWPFRIFREATTAPIGPVTFSTTASYGHPVTGALVSTSFGALSNASAVVHFSDAPLQETRIQKTSALTAQQPVSGEVIREYQELGAALEEMFQLEEDDDCRISPSVYANAQFIAADLLSSWMPAPTVFTHSPTSVVFNWSNDKNNLYLTISQDGLSALLSTPQQIQSRVDCRIAELPRPAHLLLWYHSAQQERPVLLPVNAGSDPADTNI